MSCQFCGQPMSDTEQVCRYCGNPVPAPYVPPMPSAGPIQTSDIPSEYRPLSPWAYFGLQMLYSIPVVGFIFLIIFSFKSDNLNRRAFTRSYWCALLVLGGIALIAAVVAAVIFAMGGAAVMESMGTMGY